MSPENDFMFELLERNFRAKEVWIIDVGILREPNTVGNLVV